MNYFIAPRSGEKSYKNYQSTIKNGVPLERMSQYLSSQEINILSKEEIIYVWGNRKGTVSAWNRMKNGDLVIFYAKKRLVMTCEVYLKKHSPELALALWPADEKGNPWEYVFFVKNIKYISMPIETFNLAVGYKINNIIQGFIHLGDERINKIVEQYGSVERMLDLSIDKHSEEIPLESDKLYINISKEISPIIIDDMKLTPKVKKSKKIKRGAKKIDYIARNKNNSIIGSKGERIVLELERRRLKEEGEVILANKVKQVSLDDDALGYDILSFEANGDERYIEVKTTKNNNSSMSFYVSLNEYAVGKVNKNYFIYYVEDIESMSPKVTIIENPIDSSKFYISPDGYIFRADR